MQKLLIVTGLPATGKTTVCRELAKRFSFPVISKDEYKELLFDALGSKDREWSKKIGRAAMDILFHDLENILRAGQSVIAESNFKPEFDNDKFRELLVRFKADLVQILCKADGNVVIERFINRAMSGNRHEGHDDNASIEEFRPILSKGRAEPLTIDAALIEIDTTDWTAVSFDELEKKIRTL